MDYEKLYRSYYMQVYSYAVSLSGDRELAEEIAQETFYKAVSTKASFQGRSDELTWLCAIAKRLFLDEMRKRQKITELDTLSDLSSDEDLAAAVADADTRFGRACKARIFCGRALRCLCGFCQRGKNGKIRRRCGGVVRSCSS